MPERIVRPGILTSDPINTLSWVEEIFYRRLMSVVDDFGRFDGRNSVLRANLYPLKLDHVSDSDVGKWKAGCAEAGLVRVYSVDEKEFVQIEKFDQRLRAMKSKWPAPADIRTHPHADADIRNGGGGGGAVGDGGGGDTRAPPRLSFNAAGVILGVYPLRSGLKGAVYAVEQALVEVAKRSGIADAEAWMKARVELYAASDVVKKGKIFAPRRFFEEGHYDDDSATWADKAREAGEQASPPSGGYNDSPVPSSALVEMQRWDKERAVAIEKRQKELSNAESGIPES